MVFQTSIRQREMLRRLVGYATNPVAVRLRSLRQQEQHHVVGDIEIVLPPDHNLPFYQRRDPTYDSYAIGLLTKLASGEQPVTVVDVGANVGDTAAAVLSSHPGTKVISVEGSPLFSEYLRRNLASFADRATSIEAFVGPVGSPVSFQRQGSTGHLQAGRTSGGEEPTWVSPSELISLVDKGDLLVWKSDIDGYDIHMLVEHWVAISQADVVWFEFDPPRTLGDKGDIERLIRLLADSERTCDVYDNIGRKMLRVEPGDAHSLISLTAWLHQQYEGHIVVPYLDVWAYSPEALRLVDQGAARGW